jgi:DnaJ-class molecular chaperone
VRADESGAAGDQKDCHGDFTFVDAGAPALAVDVYATYIGRMASNPYQILGLTKEASADDIRRAYRKLAKKHHPDVNPGDKRAEDKFKEISTAHDLLSDPDKRARFDRGEIDGAGQEQAPREFYRGFAEGEQGRRYRRPAPDAAAYQDIFSDFISAARASGAAQGAPRMRGQDEHYQLSVEFLEAVRGASRAVTLPDGRTLEVVIPAGLQDGQTLRLRGQGGAGWNGEAPGDALIEVSVIPHKFFRRDGDDIHLDLPVTIGEAVLGARVTVPTPGGNVAMSVPPKSDAGRQLRLRGRGVAAHAGRPAGDLYATLRIVVGTRTDEALEAALRAWMDRNPVDPRAHMTGQADPMGAAA